MAVTCSFSLPLRRSSRRDPQQVTGYAVGLDGYATAGGDTVFYGGAASPPI